MQLPMPAQFFVRLLIVATRAFSARAAIAASARHNALAQQAVCEPANMLAIRAMRNANIEAVSVMQDVATGALVVFAASGRRNWTCPPRYCRALSPKFSSRPPGGTASSRIY
jgi:hypothetical protein